MLSRIIMTLVAMLASQSAFAGSANAEIQCVSASGRTSVAVNFPVDHADAAITVTVDGKAQSYVNKDLVEILELNNRDINVEYPGHKVADLVAVKERSLINMTALTVTDQKFDDIHLSLRSTGKLNTQRGRHGAETIRFKAELTGMDPRTENQSELPKITLNCTYHYSI